MARRSGLATLSEACDMIGAALADGEWHSSRGLHERFRGRMSDGRFLDVKKALKIEHRRVGGRHGHYEWRLGR
jgi:hypothetical protein